MEVQGFVFFSLVFQDAKSQQFCHVPPGYPGGDESRSISSGGVRRSPGLELPRLLVEEVVIDHPRVRKSALSLG